VQKHIVHHVLLKKKLHQRWSSEAFFIEEYGEKLFLSKKKKSWREEIP
jgi:hypothetical protein